MVDPPPRPLARLPFVLLLLLAVAAGLWSAARQGQTPLLDQAYLAAPGSSTVSLGAGEQLVQSFLAGQNGLSQLAFLVRGEAGAPPGEVLVSITQQDGGLLHQERIPLQSIAEPYPLVVRFAPQPDSAGHGYTLSISGTGTLGLMVAPSNLYPGLLYRNGERQAEDLALDWYYSRTGAAIGAEGGRLLAGYAWPLTLSLLLWLLPGVAILVWTREAGVRWTIQAFTASSVVLSGALLIILPQFTRLLGLRLGPPAVWLLLLGAGVTLLLAHRRGRLADLLTPPDASSTLYLLLLLLLVVGRLLATHAVEVGLWGDSVHHTLITRLIVEHGGIPSDYRPYLPLQSFTYHAGFHLLSAWQAWSVPPGAAPIPAAQALLLAGQWANAWVVVSVALLAETLAERRVPGAGSWAAPVTLLLAGLLSPMPAFYTNWGRYTQLAGLLFLPAALAWSVLDWHPMHARRVPLRLVIVLAALALTHYRVVLMYAIALPFVFGLFLWQARPATLSVTLRRLLARVTLTSAVAFLLALPWYWNIARGMLLSKLEAVTASGGVPNRALQDYNAFTGFTHYAPAWLWATGAVAILWLAVRRYGAWWLLAAWMCGLLLLANPYALLRLPGTGLVNNFTIQIALFVPLCVLAGVAIGDVLARLGARSVRWARTALVVACLGLAFLAARGWWGQLWLVDPRGHAMYLPPDEEAARWIEDSLPADAVFHINGFPAFGGGVVAGSDGGWWLWNSAGRTTTVPPMIYESERGEDPDYRSRVNERFARLAEVEQAPDLLAERLREEGIEYVYIGARQGMVGLPPGETPLDPLALDASSSFETLYSDGFVWIFQVSTSPADP